MRLDGIHHISCITGDAPGNLAFYTGVLGLRLVAKTVNQDDPYVYHLFYADEAGSPGADLTFFEYPGALPRPRRRRDDLPDHPAGGLAARRWISGRSGCRGRPGADACRTTASGSTTRRGSASSWWSSQSPDRPLVARHPEIPPDVALQGFDSVRAYGGRAWRHGPAARGSARCDVGRRRRRGSCAVPSGTERSPTTRHHLGGEGWRRHRAPHRLRDRARGTGRVAAAFAPRAAISSTPIVDRYLLPVDLLPRTERRAVSNWRPRGPGFTVDLPLERLGSELVLPPMLAGRRAEIEAHLTPLPDPRAAWS